MQRSTAIHVRSMSAVPLTAGMLAALAFALAPAAHAAAGAVLPFTSVEVCPTP
ncbi:hypothetical protein [Streptomyces sp. NPDC086777]|uniref:hypothetical protein n=1 Tax=Streptomyces sp. NPDC086777 TaxID=3154866 RepID=UPI00344BEB2B